MNIILISYLIMICASICMILTTNPVYGLKFLIVIFLNFGFILVYYNVIYLGFIFIMVYVGAVTILFLFVVMMLDIKFNIMSNTNYLTVGFLFTFLFTLILFNLLNNSHNEIPSILVYNNSVNVNFYSHVSDLLYDFNVLQVIGVLIFNYLYVYLLTIGVLLLVATVGAIYLTHNTEAVAIRKQYMQTDRSNSLYYVFYSNKLHDDV